MTPRRIAAILHKAGAAALAFALLVPVAAVAAEVRVAVAANFAAPMKRIAQDFERDTGHRATLSFGGTGQFHAQVRHGAPFAVLLAADAETPLKLVNEGWAVGSTRHTYAIGRLVLWSRQPGAVDPQGQVLKAGAFERIAIANPKLAPYGAAAMEVLDRMGLRESIAPKIVEGAHIAQAYQFAASGNAALGFVALSQVFEGGRLREGSAWIVPASLHAPIRQDAVVLKAGRDNPAAAALMAYLKSDKARDVIRSHGYSLAP